MVETNNTDVQSEKNYILLKSASNSGFNKLETETVDLEKREETRSNFEKLFETGVRDEYTNPFVIDKLINIVASSPVYLPVFDAFTTNTVGFGYNIVPRVKNYDNESFDKTNEYSRVENFLRYVNPDNNISELCKQLLFDYCFVSYFYCEITRDIDGKPDGLYRLPFNSVKPIRKQENITTYSTKRIHRNDNGTYDVKQKVDSKRFRLFVQELENGSTIYYKEFQDPNHYTKDDGKLLTNKRDINSARKSNNLANEIWFFSDPVVKGVYPLPKYAGCIIDSLGDISAAKTNYSTLKQNLIPSMAIIGDLDKNSIDRIKEFQLERQGDEYNRSKILVLTAEVSDNDLNTGNNKIEIEKLRDEQINDSMFDQYREKHYENVMQAFRIPKILVSKGEPVKDRQTLEATLKFADEQIFNPIRVKVQRFINDYLLPELDINSLVIEFNTPNVTDPKTIIDIVSYFEKSGAMTPERAAILLEYIIGKKLPKVEGIDLKKPFSITVAESIKNQADPTNMNQQVIADRMKDPNKDAKHNERRR